MHSSRHKIIITGTGRAGTTFLVQLLTELGLDTGYTPASWHRDYFKHCSAGLERDVEDPASPTIVKSPELCENLSGIIARGQVAIEHALIPVRDLDEAARSRIRIGGDGTTPGGLAGTTDAGRQKAVLAERFHRLLHTLTEHDIPHTLLLFPRFARDADYAYAKLGFLTKHLSREDFRSAFACVARPDLIHDFRSAGALADSGGPAREHARALRRKRWRRRARRWITGGSFLAMCTWILTTQVAHSPAFSTTDVQPVTTTAAATSENPAILRARVYFSGRRPYRNTAESIYLSPSLSRWMILPPPAPDPAALPPPAPPGAFDRHD